MTTPAVRDQRGGFALALVVLMLFAIAVAGATGYQVVTSEFVLAQQNRDGQKALAVARAGVQRFLGETVGQVGDSVSYAIGDGVAVVTTRKVMEKDSLNHLYFIKSEGQVADQRTPLLPAVRSVGTYAWHRLNPIALKGSVMLTGGMARVYYGSFIDGRDYATTGDCPGGGTTGASGIATAGTIGNYGGSLIGGTGFPPGDTGYPNFAAMYDTVGVRWDILRDPSFPVDFDNTWPNFSSLPADSFPIVRYNGNLAAWGNWYSGRGVLIVTGRLIILYDFQWDGIILAGQFYYATGSGSSTPRINGLLIGGLESNLAYSYFLSGNFNYHSCNAYAANRSLSYLEVVDNALFEINN